MGSGFVLSALASTGAWEYISGKNIKNVFSVDEVAHGIQPTLYGVY